MRWWEKEISKESRCCLSPVVTWYLDTALVTICRGRKDSVVLMGLGKNHRCQAVGVIQGGDALGLTAAAHRLSCCVPGPGCGRRKSSQQEGLCTKLCW